MGFGLADPVARPLLVPYFGGESGRRYYQDAAIRAVLEKIARCEHEDQPAARGWPAYPATPLPH